MDTVRSTPALVAPRERSERKQPTNGRRLDRREAGRAFPELVRANRGDRAPNRFEDAARRDGSALAKARIARAHHARLAELHAYRHEQALADRRHTQAARSKRDYRRAARRCRLLGEFLRSDSSRPPADDGAARTPVAYELAAAMRGL